MRWSCGREMFTEYIIATEYSILLRHNFLTPFCWTQHTTIIRSISLQTHTQSIRYSIKDRICCSHSLFLYTHTQSILYSIKRLNWLLCRQSKEYFPTEERWDWDAPPCPLMAYCHVCVLAPADPSEFRALLSRIAWSSPGQLGIIFDVAHLWGQICSLNHQNWTPENNIF